jgi:hypothetical protein
MMKSLSYAGMKVHIRLRRTDFLEKKEEIIADTNGLFNDERLLYLEEDGKTHQKITFHDNAVIIDREGTYGSKIVLPDDAAGQCMVYSPYGEMAMDASLCDKHKEDGKWLVEYKISSAQQLVMHVKLEWEFSAI